MIHPINKTYICLDCVFLFTIHGEKKGGVKYTFCPSCGENINVELFRPEKKKPIVKKLWDAWELELIDRIMDGELKAYQVAYVTNRTEKSVKRRAERRKLER